jgi:hypothetical protein
VSDLLRDRLLLWALAPIVVAFAAAAACVGTTADAVRGAALAALLLAMACAAITAATMTGSTARVLAGVLASTLVRLVGAVGAAALLCLALGHPAVPTVITIGACAVAGLAIETLARWRGLALVKEPSRG